MPAPAILTLVTKHIDLPTTEVRKLGRNDRCHCGSGRKYKRCHSDYDRIYGYDGKFTSLIDTKQKPDVPRYPEYICILGAGASYGSDSESVRQRGLLPPLGKALFRELESDPALKYWHNVPDHLKSRFQNGYFEEAMSALLEETEQFGLQWRRDIELSLYFSRFHPLHTNLYMQLAKVISQNVASGWMGAIITLNYERLLEESLLLAGKLFPIIEGIEFYDLQRSDLPLLNDFEICYPHGACHLFLSSAPFGPDLKVNFHGKLEGGGFNHLFDHRRIRRACEGNVLPIICRYDANKPVLFAEEFINIQRSRYNELVANARRIAIVGMQCHSQYDPHMWEPLAETDAEISYYEPSPQSLSVFQSWVSGYHKEEGVDYTLYQGTFLDSFGELCMFLDLSI